MMDIPVYHPGYSDEDLAKFLSPCIVDGLGSPSFTPYGSEASTSSAGTPRPASKRPHPDKPKRKQFSSCDACRLRKVKCIRADGNATAACDSCSSKGISCSNGYSKEQQYGKGKRIQAARDACGQAVVPAERSLFEKALSSNALSGLLHAYANDVQTSLPFIDFTRIQQVCQEAHFDVGRLDEMDQLLCLCVTATAALVQDSRQQQQEGTSYLPATMAIYSPLGTSHDLAQKAIAEADRLGLLRIPSMKGLQVLRLLCLLTSADEAKHLRRSGAYRAYERALVDHARSLMDTDELLEPQISALFWDLFILDSFACAVSGQSPSFTDEDIANFASFVEYSTEGMLNTISDLDATSADNGIGLIFAGICRLLRSIYKRVTSLAARRRPFLDLEMLQDILPEIERLTSVQEVFTRKLNSIFGPTWPENLYFWSKLASFLNTYTVVIGLGELEKATSQETLPAPSANRLQVMKQLHWALQAKLVADTHTSWINAPPSGTMKILGSVDGMMSFLSVVRLRTVLNLATHGEQGLQPGIWSMEDKARATKFYLGVCEGLGDTVTVHSVSIQKELPALRAQVADIEDRARAQFPAAHDYPFQPFACPGPVPAADLASHQVHMPQVSDTTRFTDLPGEAHDLQTFIEQYCSLEQTASDGYT